MAKKKKAKAKKKAASYNPLSYVGAVNPGTYTSAYTDQINNTMNEMNIARQNLMNFKYDPMQDANYQAYAQIYGARGDRAAQDTLGDAAALNGGFGTSYATSAAQQARNQYNQELAMLVPDLEAQAYNRLQTNYGLLQDNYNMLQDADAQAYNRYRDQVADFQWGKNYDTDIYQFNLAQSAKGSSGGGGGRKKRSSGGGYAGSYGGSGLDLAGIYTGVQNALAEDPNKKKKKGSGAGGGGGYSNRVNKKTMMTK